MKTRPVEVQYWLWGGYAAGLLGIHVAGFFADTLTLRWYALPATFVLLFATSAPRLPGVIGRLFAVSAVFGCAAFVVYSVLDSHRDVADGLVRPRAWESVHPHMSRERAYKRLGQPSYSSRNEETWERKGDAGGYRRLRIWYGPFGSPDTITQIQETLSRPGWGHEVVVNSEEMKGLKPAFVCGNGLPSR